MKAEDKPNRSANLNRHTLVNAMVKQPGYRFSKHDTYNIVNVMLNVMKRHLNHRGAIKLAKFGTFKLLFHSERVVHNPRSRGNSKNDQIHVNGHYALRFIPSRQWYAKIKTIPKS